ncbi:hypothetical protein ABPG74_008591 [Tetrahymena malaccensis]
MKKYILISLHIFVLQIVSSLCGTIQGWDLEKIQGYDGSTSGYRFYINLDSGLGPNDFIQIVFPRNLGTSVQASLYLYQNNMLIANQRNFAYRFVEPVPFQNSFNYFFQFGYQLQPQTWYTLILNQIIQPPTQTLYQDPIMIQTVSDPCTQGGSCSPIIYDMNHSFALLYDTLPQSLPSPNIKVSFQAINNYNLLPGSSYYTFIDITPTVSDPLGATYFISIQQSTANQGLGISQDFRFKGACYSDVVNCNSNSLPGCITISQVQNSTCIIDQLFGTLTFNVNQALVQGQIFRIKVEVENPIYQSQRDLNIYAVGKTSQTTIEKGTSQNALKTQLINISHALYTYLWGIPDNQPFLSGDIPYTLFRSGPNLFTMNSVKVSFTVDQTIPMGQEFIVTVCFGQATDILTNSIVTNLPRLDLNLNPTCYTQINPAINSCVICEQVGALAYQNYNYFVAAKVYYSSSTPLQITSFGAVSVILKNQQSAVLYNPFLGDTIQLQANTEYLDLNGFHSNQFGIGYTQIVSVPDNQSLSGTADGIGQFLSSSKKNTVGIIPQSNQSQQLLFLLQVPQASYVGLTQNPGNSIYNFRMSVMFNPNVLSYQQGFDQFGIDFAAFQLGTGSVPNQWNVNQVACYAANTCTWYNQNGQNKPNNNLQYSPSTTTAVYNIQRFDCITSNFGDCNNWQGYKTTASGFSGVFSMRRVQFKSGFQSQIQPDDQLLDFVIAFQRGLITGSNQVQYSLVTAQLINAYTISYNQLQNAKISFVNFSDKTLNPGHKIPTFLRIGGSIMPSEDLQATAIAVFFDQSIEVNWFYDEQGMFGRQTNKQVGCSAGECYLYDAKVVNGYETWMNNAMVLATDLMNIENEFNLLIPVQNVMGASSVSFPTRLNIAFCNFNRTSLGVRNQLNVLSVYRVYGATVNGVITQPITPINGLNQNLFPNTLSFSSLTWQADTGYLAKYTLQTQNVQPFGSTNTLFAADSSTTFPAGTFNPTYKGAGVTLCSLYFDVFSPSQLQFASPPYGVIGSCTNFSYTFNDNSNGGLYADYDEKRIYCSFCPIDQPYPNLNTAQGNIVWNNPYFNQYFTANLNIQSIFTYAFSSSVGKIFSMYSDSQQVSSLNYNTCIINNIMNPIYPNSLGKQVLQLSYQIKAQLQLDSQAQIGFGFAQIVFTFSQSISQITFVANTCTLLTQSSTQLTCSFSTTSNAITFVISPISTYLFQVLETVTFQIYAKTNGLTTGIPNLTYQVSVNLPTIKGGNVRIFGLDANAAANTYALFAQCTGGSFSFSTMSYSNFMSVGSLQFDIFNVGARSPFNFTFIPQQRERFYSSSYFSIDFGFLRAGNANLVGDNKFRCVVYEAPSTLTQTGTSTYGSYSISWRWQHIEYNAALKDVRIYPKTDIMQPSNYNFLLQCYGGVVPAPGAVEASEVLQASWMDGTDTLQKTASPYPYPSQNIISTTNIQSSVVQLQKKYWVSNGNEAIYSFQLQTNNFNLDYFSRIYIEFPYFIPPGINRENNPECYIRINSVASNSFPAYSDYSLAYCEITGERRISVWSNKQIALGTVFYLDVYGVLQPTFYRSNTINPQIWIGFDNDSLFSNGVQEFNFIADQKTPSPALSPSFPLLPFTITSVQVSNTIIRSTFTLTITFIQDLSQLQPGYFMYLLLTQSLSDMNKLGQINACTLFNQGDMNTNLAQECDFLSSRLIIIKRNSQSPSSASTSNSFVLAIQNLPTPNYVPPLVKNNIRFLLYNSYGLSNLFDQYVDYMGLNYQGGVVSFNSDPNRQNLGWYIYNLVKNIDPANSNNNVVAQNFESNGVVYVYIGYYKKLIQLQPDNQNAFSLNMNITFSGNTSKFSFKPNTFNAISGNTMMQFSMAALQTTPTGIEILNANKIGDPQNVYTPIPPLKVIISGQLCQINSRFSTYNIPIGGFSLPIELDFFNCMPVNDITYTPIFNNLSSNNLNIASQYLVNTVTSSKLDPRMFFVIQEISKDRSKIGNAITLDFKIGGTNGQSYQTPVDITLILVDPNQSSYSLSPVASQIPSVQIGQNNVTFSMQCSQPSIIFWVVGLNPSLSNIDDNAMKSQVTGANGLIPNITDPNDPNLKMFGTEIAYSATPLTKVFNNLRPNGNYDFKYFCLNQMNQQSTIQTTSWKIPDNGSFLMKLTFSFSQYITFIQQKNIACALAQYFSIPPARVITDFSTTCSNYPNYQNLNVNNFIVRTQQNGQYLYSFYIQPNYLATTDLTNLAVREQVNANNFIMSFLNTVSNSSSLPSLTDVSTQDIVSVNIPDIAQTGQLLTQQTVTYAYFTLRAVDGYIIVGLEQGSQNNIPSASQIKQGLNSQNATLFTFEMRQSKREVQQEFKFIQLQPGTTYTAYFYGSNDDPSPNAITTQPIVLNFKTIGDSYSVKTVSSKILCFAYILIALLIII